MTMRLALWIIATFTGSIALVVGLSALSKDIREQPGSFLRQYPPHPVLESTKLRIDDDHYYFAGATSSHVYLANTAKPLDLLKIDLDMSDTSKVHLNIDGIDGTRYVRITVAIDSPYFYFMDGAIPYVYRGNIKDWTAVPLMKDSAYFIEAVPMSASSFAIRALSSKTKQYVLGKMIINSNPLKLNHDILERQIDGTFDVDGSFSFNKQMNRLVYVYYYRNQYMVMDSNINLRYRGNTIDTFKTAQIRISEIDSEKSRTLSAPPITTNKGHATYKDWLLIHSLLPAKNENMKRFKNASVVDVYNINLQQYQFSFYVYDEDATKMRELIVVGDNFYALFDHSIRKLDIVEHYFKSTIRIDQE